MKSRHFNNPNRFICEVRPGARVFSMGAIQSFDAKFTPAILTDPHPNLYYENDDVGFPHLLPVLYLLLYACVHWRREAADLRIF